MEDRARDAYAAGLIDGEGTVALARIHSNTERAPVVSFSSTSPELIAFFRKNYGGKTISKKVYASRHAPSWEWRVTHDAALRFLKRILPFLRHAAKRHRTGLLLAQYKQVTARNGRYSPELLLRKRDFEHRFFHPSAP